MSVLLQRHELREVKVRPDDQLDLSPEELEKEVPPRVLYPLNPRRSCME